MTEKQLHKSICDYIKLQYPKALFNTDMSGIKLTIGQATQAKKLRSGNGFPDIVIYEEGFGKHFKGEYYALFLEVKKETPFKKNGYLKLNKHFEDQYTMLHNLEQRRFKAVFVWSFDMAKDIIDKYLIGK